MSENQNPKLHLPDLSIKNFRGIQDLSIKQFGRVTLLAGRNGVGKTTVLEAVRVYAARGRREIFEKLLRKRYEFVTSRSEDHGSVPDYTTLFFGRHVPPAQAISIGPNTEQDQLRIEATNVEELYPVQLDIFSEAAALEPNLQALKVTFRNSKSMIPCFLGSPESESFLRISRMLRRRISGDSDLPDPIACESLGPELLSNSMLARFWDNAIITGVASLALAMINLTEAQIDQVAAVGESSGRLPGEGRRIIVKPRHSSRYVPLNSLGDGIMRLFAVALALAHSRNGFLVIDEAENGIHHSVLRDLWSMILAAAQKYNVQVFATTHSFDCVKAFARAAVENEGVEGVLVRLDQKNGKLKTVEVKEEQLKVAADQDIRVI